MRYLAGTSTILWRWRGHSLPIIGRSSRSTPRFDLAPPWQRELLLLGATCLPDYLRLAGSGAGEPRRSRRILRESAHPGPGRVGSQ